MFTINAPKNKPLSIYGIIRPLYVVARFFGFFPFSLRSEKGGVCKICFTILDSVIFFIQVSIYSCLTYVNIVYDLMGDSPNSQNSAMMSPILALGTRIGLIFGLINSIAFLLAELFNRHQIFGIFKLYQDFDAQLQSLMGSNLNNKMNKRCVYVYVVTCGAIAFIYGWISFWICKDFFDLTTLVVSFTSFFLATSVFGSSLSIYSFFIFNVASRYCLLNEMFRKLTKTSGFSVAVTTTTTTSSTAHFIDNVMKLAELHDLLNNVLDKVNRCYSIQVMLAFATSFIFVVFSLFSVYRGWITRTVSIEQFNISVVLTVWASFYIFFVFIVLWAGDSSKNEGKFTGVLVHRAINKCHNTEIVERLMTFSNQINSRTPDANCKLFSFDWTLLFSIVAATTTYLIILIQFDASGYEPLTFGSKNFTLNN